MTSRRRTLVFCRAGERSLHRRWAGDPATRSFDLWLDCWCDPARWAGEPGAKVTDGRGTMKWPRLAALVAGDPGAFAPYDLVWLPDDDVDIGPAALEAFFAIALRHKLDLAQPALADGCYWSHAVTLAHRGFVLRHTNFVEVMAPAFSRAGLAACASTFGEGTMGWGIDLVWSRALGDPCASIGVVDATPMVHTQPVGGAGWYDLQRAGEEMRTLTARHGVGFPFAHRQHGAVLRRADGGDGPTLGRGPRLAARLLAGAPPSQRWRAAHWTFVLRSLRAAPAPVPGASPLRSP